MYQIYFRMTLYMFWMACLGGGYPLVSRQQYLFDKYLLLYVQYRTPDDGWKDRPKHVVCHSKINKFDTLVHLVGLTIGLFMLLNVCKLSKNQQRKRSNFLMCSIEITLSPVTLNSVTF